MATLQDYKNMYEVDEKNKEILLNGRVVRLYGSGEVFKTSNSAISALAREAMFADMSDEHFINNRETN